MFRNPKIYLLTLLISSYIKLVGQQEVAKYPIQFSQYYNCFPLLNPSSSGTNSDFSVAMGNKRLLGNFSNIATYYLNADMRVGQQSKYYNSPFSVIGLLVYNDREGKYLNRSRFYATYGWHGNLNQKVMFSGGFHLGGMNYSVKGTPLSGDGSDFVPDGTIGLSIYNQKFHVGVAIAQIFNNEIQPLEEVAKLSQYFNFTGNYRLKPSHLFEIQPVFALRVPVNGDRILTDVTFLGTYKEMFRVVVGVHKNNMMINAVEFRNILDGERGLNFGITYSYPLINTGISTSFIELGLSFNLNTSTKL